VDASDYLWNMYNEHTSQGRHHEAQRTAVSTVVLALAGAVVAVIAQGHFRRTWPLAAFLILLGLVGALFSQKQAERTRMHITIAGAFRHQLEQSLTSRGLTVLPRGDDLAVSLNLFAVRRADIEGFARDLEAKGRARATVTRRLCTIAGFYKYAVEEELLEHSPAAHVRRPRVDYESHATALDRNELGAMLVAAGLGRPLEHALVSLLSLNGLRVSEATGADIEHLGPERGHQVPSLPDADPVVLIRAARSSPSRSPRAPPGRSTWQPANVRTARSS